MSPSRHHLSLPLLPLLVAVAAVFTPAAAWGPVAHAVFTCKGLYPEMPVADCVAGTSALTANGVLAAASDLPDAFGFGAFNVDAQGSGLCLNLTYVHDPVFGGTMINLLAGSTPFDATVPLPPQLAMARGFLGHIAGDLVGFNPTGGILCTNQSGGCTRNTILYMPEWSYMTALDAALWIRHDLHSLPVLGADMSSYDAFNFLSNASHLYAQSTPSFPTFSADEAKACATFWSGNAAFVGRRAEFVATTASAQMALDDEIQWFMPKGGIWMI